MLPKIPTTKFSNGVVFPLFGLGSWQAKDAVQLRGALEAALDAGYRYIDTAQLYQNEHIIGEFLEDAIKSVKSHGNDPRVDPSNATPLLTPHIDTWRVLEKFYKLGKFRAIGISNFNEQQIQELYDQAEIKPHNLQVECHIVWPQNELFELCKKLGIAFTSYATMGSPGRTIKDADEPNLFEIPLVVELAKKHHKAPAQILLRQMVQRGISTIPKSVTPSRVCENIDIFYFELTPEQMARFDTEVKPKKRLFWMNYALKHPWYPYRAELPN